MLRLLLRLLAVNLLFLTGCAVDQYQKNDRNIDASFSTWNGKIRIISSTSVGDKGTPFGHSVMYAAAAITGVSTDSTYGHSPSNPVKVRKVNTDHLVAERYYLSTLLDTLSNPIAFERLGSAFSYTHNRAKGNLDVYVITTIAGKDTLFLDAYRQGDLLAPTGYQYSINPFLSLEKLSLSQLTDPEYFYRWDDVVYDMAREVIKADQIQMNLLWAKGHNNLANWLFSDPRNYNWLQQTGLADSLQNMDPFHYRKAVAYCSEYVLRVYPEKVDGKKLFPVLISTLLMADRGQNPGVIPASAALQFSAQPSPRLTELHYDADQMYRQFDDQVDSSFTHWDGELSYYPCKIALGKGYPFGHSWLHAVTPLKGSSNDPKYGRCPSQPVKIGGDSELGETNALFYLNTLLDSNGRPISFEHLGSGYEYEQAMQNGKVRKGKMDLFVITSAAGCDTLFLDMYRSDSLYAPAGYQYSTLVDSTLDKDHMLTTSNPVNVYTGDFWAFGHAINALSMKKGSPQKDWIADAEFLEQWAKYNTLTPITIDMSGLPPKIANSPFYRMKYIAYFVEYTYREYPNRVSPNDLMPLIRNRLLAIQSESGDTSLIPPGSAVLPSTGTQSRFYELDK